MSQQDNSPGSGNKKKFQITGTAIAVIVLLAVIIIKLAAGNTGDTMLGAAPAPSIFDIYKVEIPDFDGSQYVAQIHGGEPFFSPDEITDVFYTKLSPLDSYGRAGSAIMCADEPHIQTGERSDISQIHPSGWHSGGFYQRSHLLMWKLTGNNEPENLVTGTATFNGTNMQDYEKKVTRYLWDHENNHVMYRVTPLFLKDELVCRGVLMEAYSVEDDGALSFCVFVYNAEPGASIDYATGDYMENAENLTEERQEDQK